MTKENAEISTYFVAFFFPFYRASCRQLLLIFFFSVNDKLKNVSHVSCFYLIFLRVRLACAQLKCSNLNAFYFLVELCNFAYSRLTSSTSSRFLSRSFFAKHENRKFLFAAGKVSQREIIKTTRHVGSLFLLLHITPAISITNRAEKTQKHKIQKLIESEISNLLFLFFF